METKIELKMPSPIDWDKCCRVCGFTLTIIRGRYPDAGNRKVCAQCLQERMDLIREYSDPDYGVAYQAKP